MPLTLKKTLILEEAEYADLVADLQQHAWVPPGISRVLESLNAMRGKYIGDSIRRVEFGHTLVRNGKIEPGMFEANICASSQPSKIFVIATQWYLEDLLYRNKAKGAEWLHDYSVVQHVSGLSRGEWYVNLRISWLP